MRLAINFANLGVQCRGILHVHRDGFGALDIFAQALCAFQCPAAYEVLETIFDQIRELQLMFLTNGDLDALFTQERQCGLDDEACT